MIEDEQNRQVADFILKIIMLQRLKNCFLKVLAKRQALEAEIMEIKKGNEGINEKETEKIRQIEYLKAKIQSFKNQERRLYQKIKWIEEQLRI
ncbi:MAG: hypothetical protein QXX99_07510 [Candidatus Bathyarchaeia archaeon]